jgi:hypothetical protein
MILQARLIATFAYNNLAAKVEYLLQQCIIFPTGNYFIDCFDDFVLRAISSKNLVLLDAIMNRGYEKVSDLSEIYVFGFYTARVSNSRKLFVFKDKALKCYIGTT